jgi:hypothetical protein
VIRLAGAIPISTGIASRCLARAHPGDLHDSGRCPTVNDDCSGDIDGSGYGRFEDLGRPDELCAAKLVRAAAGEQHRVPLIIGAQSEPGDSPADTTTGQVSDCLVALSKRTFVG